MAKAKSKVNKKIQANKVGGQGFRGADVIGMLGGAVPKSGSPKAGKVPSSMKVPSKKLVTSDSPAMTDFVGTTEIRNSAFEGTVSPSDYEVEMERINKSKEDLVMSQLRGEPSPVMEEQVKKAPAKKKAVVKKKAKAPAKKAAVKKKVTPGKISYTKSEVKMPVLGAVASGKY